MAHSTEKEAVIPQQFPAGVRVLVIDHDTTLLNAIQQMSIRCRYRVTTCSQALVALDLLRKREACFDVILMDVHIPDMDGYDFLQYISQELKIPVIIMSVDATTSAVMKAIKHGACDYWIKPLHEEQFRNMWQHVARKALSENKPHEIIDLGQSKRGKDESSEGEDKDYYPPPTKKARVAWSPELHQEFVRAVTQLGFEKAVPKRILEVMNVPGLTREHIASHLQKFRLYLKKTTEEKQPQNGMSKAISKVGGSRGFDFPAFATTSHVPLETMAAGLLQVPKEDQSAIMKSTPIQWPNPSHAEHTMAYGSPQVVSNIVACRNNFPQSNNMILDGSSSSSSSSSRYGAWHPPNVLMNALPLQQHQQPLMNLVQFNSFNNCMVVSGASEEGNINQASFNQNSGFGSNNSLNSNNPLFGVAQHYFGFNPPTGLEIESSVSDFGSGKVSSDIDNVNTRGEEPDSIINSSEEDHPFA